MGISECSDARVPSYRCSTVHHCTRYHNIRTLKTKCISNTQSADMNCRQLKAYINGLNVIYMLKEDNYDFWYEKTKLFQWFHKINSDGKPEINTTIDPITISLYQINFIWNIKARQLSGQVQPNYPRKWSGYGWHFKGIQYKVTEKWSGWNLTNMTVVTASD